MNFQPDSFPVSWIVWSRYQRWWVFDNVEFVYAVYLSDLYFVWIIFGLGVFGNSPGCGGKNGFVPSASITPSLRLICVSTKSNVALASFMRSLLVWLLAPFICCSKCSAFQVCGRWLVVRPWKPFAGKQCEAFSTNSWRLFCLQSSFLQSLRHVVGGGTNSILCYCLYFVAFCPSRFVLMVPLCLSFVTQNLSNFFC